MRSQASSEDKRQEQGERKIIRVGDSHENLEQRQDEAYHPPRGKEPPPPPPPPPPAEKNDEE